MKATHAKVLGQGWQGGGRFASELAEATGLLVRHP